MVWKQEIKKEGGGRGGLRDEEDGREGKEKSSNIHMLHSHEGEKHGAYEQHMNIMSRSRAVVHLPHYVGMQPS